MNWKRVVVGIIGVLAVGVGVFVIVVGSLMFGGSTGAQISGATITVIGAVLFIGALPWKRILNLLWKN